MRAGELALWLPQRFGRPYEVLSREEATHGSSYLGDGIHLRPSGDTILKVDGKTYVDCRLDQRQSVWEHAKLSGVDFRGTGNEPGWYIEIRNDLETRDGKRIRFVFDYGQQEAVLHAPDPDKCGSQTSFSG